jgi:argininosuccinate synthase
MNLEAKHTNLTIVDKYYDKAIKYLFFGNVLKNNTYPLSVSAERVFFIEAIKYKICWRKCHCSRSTGAEMTNRFDLIFQTIAPEIEIITPIRDLKLDRKK